MTGISSNSNNPYQNSPFNSDISKFRAESDFDEFEVEDELGDVNEGEKQKYVGSKKNELGESQKELGDHVLKVKELSPEEKQAEITKMKFQEKTPSADQQTKVFLDIGKAQELIMQATVNTTEFSGEFERLVDECKLDKCPYDEAVVRETMKNPFKENKKEYASNDKKIKKIDVKIVKIDKELASNKKFLESHVIIQENKIIHLNPDNPDHAKYFEHGNIEIGFMIKDKIYFHSDLKEKFDADPSLQLTYDNKPLLSRKIKKLSNNKFQKLHHKASKSFSTYQNLNIQKQVLVQERTVLIERQNLLLYAMQMQLLLMQRENNKSKTGNDLQVINITPKILQLALILSAHRVLQDQKGVDSKNQRRMKEMEEFIKESAKSKDKSFWSLIIFFKKFHARQERIKYQKDIEEQQKLIRQSDKKSYEEHFRLKASNDQAFVKKRIKSS